MSSPDARSRRITSVVAATLAGVLYLATLFPGIGGVLNHGDSAKFQFLGFVWGVGHPPGNPLYLGSLALFQSLPFGTAGLRANLASAVCGALAVGFTANAAHRMAGVRASVVAASFLALGGLVWEFATEAEVYAFNSVFVSFMLYAFTRAEIEGSTRMAALGVAAFVMGIAGHLSLVVAGPGVLLFATSLLWRGIKPSLHDMALVVGAGLVCLGSYALLPVLHARSVYSEYNVEPGLAGLIEFATGAKWRSGIKLPALEEALSGRTLSVVKVLLRQWTLPVWLGAPMAFYALHRRFPGVARFAITACLAWLTFLYLYDIPDPDGLVVPIACCVAPALGVAVASAARFRLTAAIAGCALLPTALLHVQQYRQTVGFEILQDVNASPGREALDMPDLIGGLPENAHLTLPCLHYGCAQVMNYYRFADEAVQERHVRIVGLKGSRLSRWHSPPPSIDPRLGLSQVVCTVQERESTLLSSKGVRMQKRERGELHVAGKTYQRLPVYCSQPGQSGARNGS